MPAKPVVRAAAALADGNRVRILRAISGAELCVCELCDALGLTQSTLSTHLRVLRDAGLLTSRREASWVYYAVVPEALAALSTLLSTGADSVAAVGVSV